jgi:hypothetical protein
MHKYVFVSYFRDPDPDRKEELLICLHSNAENPDVHKVIVFLENSSHSKDLDGHEKIILVHLNRRLEFKDAFDYARENIEDGSIVVISNLDIFLETSDEWANIDRDFFQAGYPDKALVCCRHNLDENLQVWTEEDSWRRGEFCDAWVFKTPIKPEFLEENLRFCVGGAPQCDNLMMYLMSKYYHTYSWGSKYKIYHYDVCRKSDGPKMILNDKTDMRPSKRKREHIAISAFQNWDLFLKEQIEPQYVPTWRIVYENGEEKYYPI